MYFNDNLHLWEGIINASNGIDFVLNTLPNITCLYQMVESAKDGSMRKLYTGMKGGNDYGDYGG